MLVTMIESTGDYLAIGEVCHEPVKPHDIAAGIRAEGIGTMLGGLMNSFPFTTFSQNTGVLRISGVRSRWVVAVTALFMMPPPLQQNASPPLRRCAGVHDDDAVVFHGSAG